jgi:hypothetical protein
MSGARRSINVIRTYKPKRDDCLRALAALLKKPVSNEGSPSPATLSNDGRVKGDSADARIISD